MGVVKRSVSLDEWVAEHAERAAREEGVSFSTWLSATAEHALRLREGRRDIEEYEAERGAFTPEEKAAGRALLAKLMAEVDALEDQ